MSEVPTTAWTAGTDGGVDTGHAPFPADWRRSGTVSHAFTHFALELVVFRADTGALPAPPGHWWSPAQEIHSEALPSVMKKAIEAAVPGATRKPPRQRPDFS
jgi:A/G-specific adenine glycosylase